MDIIISVVFRASQKGAATLQALESIALFETTRFRFNHHIVDFQQFDSGSFSSCEVQVRSREEQFVERRLSPTQEDNSSMFCTRCAADTSRRFG